MAPTVDGGEEGVGGEDGCGRADPPCGILARSEGCTERVVYEGGEALAEGVCSGRVGTEIGGVFLALQGDDQWEWA